MTPRRALALAAWFVLAAPPARAQWVRPAPSSVPRADSAFLARAAAPALVPAAGPLRDRPWLRPIASLIVPGSGQLAAGQQRGLAYLAAEVWLVARALSLEARGRRERERYRALAFDVARRQFTTRRVDGPFPYYEFMERYVESGLYDLDVGTAFVPEADTATFNGAMWLLARRTYWTDPDSFPAADSPAYLASLAFYQARAVGGEFRWSWRDARLEQDVFRQSIRASDESFRTATNYLGAIVVNHLVSAIDALIATRRTTLPAPRVRGGPDAVRLEWTVGF